jgi:hypothetical protein
MTEEAESVFRFFARCMHDTRESLIVPFEALRVYQAIQEEFELCKSATTGRDVPCSVLLFAIFLVVHKFIHTTEMGAKEWLRYLTSGKSGLLVERRCECLHRMEHCLKRAFRMQEDVVECLGDFSLLLDTNTPIRRALAVETMSGNSAYHAICKAYAEAVGCPTRTAESRILSNRISWLQTKCTCPPASWFWVCGDFTLL